MRWRTTSTGMGTGLVDRLAQANIDELSPRPDEVLLVALGDDESAGLRQLVGHAIGLRVREVTSLESGQRRMHDPATVAAVVVVAGPGLQTLHTTVVALRRAAPDTAIIVLDDIAAAERQAVAHHAGADAVVVSGESSPEMLNAALREAMDQRAADRAVGDTLTRAGDASIIAAAGATRAAEAQRTAIASVQRDGTRSGAGGRGTAHMESLTVALAVRLRSELRPHDVMARLSEDRFCIVRQEADEFFAAAFADRLLVACRRPLTVLGQTVDFSVSIGLSTMRPGADLEDALRESRQALERAQTRGGHCYELFDEEGRARVLANRQMESALRHAFEQREFRVHYQPVVDLATHRVTSFEALMRWKRPGAGMVYPAAFVQSAERSGLMVRIGAAVIHRAAQRAQEWGHDTDSPRAPAVSVNLSAQEFLQPRLVATIAEALGSTALRPDRLQLECPAGLLHSDPETSRSILRQLQRLGVVLVADDVDGASITEVLSTLPIDILKLPMALVRDIDTDENRREVVSRIMEQARSASWVVVAKGVETAAQVAALSALGITGGQGFLFSDARPAEELPAAFQHSDGWRVPPGSAQPAPPQVAD